MRDKESYLLEFLNKSFLDSVNLEDYTDITYNGFVLYGFQEAKRKRRLM